MYPVLLDWGPFFVQSYVLMLCLGFVAAMLLWFRLNRLSPQPWPEAKMLQFALETLGVALLGARALFMLVQWPLYQQGYFQWWAFWEGGLVFYGGLIAGAAYVLWRSGRLGWVRLMVLNSLVAPLAVGHALGRMGCFLNGCCHGGVCAVPHAWCFSVTSPWAATQPKGMPLFPSQLLESAGLLLLAVLLVWAYKRWLRLKLQAKLQAKKFQPLILYLGGYGLLRFGVELGRGDTLRGAWWGLSTSQWISIGMLACALVLLWRRPIRQ